MAQVERLRTLLVDDHPAFLVGMRLIMIEQGGLEIIGEAIDGREALILAEQHHPELAFIDIHLPDVDGIQLTEQMSHRFPSCSIIGLSVIDEPAQIAKMLRAGAVGYVLKTEPLASILEAVAAVRRGIRYLPPSVSRDEVELHESGRSKWDLLSRREREICEYLFDGSPNVTIATALFISVRTVETHRLRIMTKLGIRNAVQLYQFSIRHGFRRR